jgi:gliding motility-associated-like protein
MMKQLYILFLFIVAFCNQIYLGQNHDNGWFKNYNSTKGFIENKGQFDARAKALYKDTAIKVFFVYDGGTENYYFTSKGLAIELNQKSLRNRTDLEKAERNARKLKGFNSLTEWQEFQNIDSKNRIVSSQDVLFLEWENASSKVTIIPEKKNLFYHSYSFKNDQKVIESITDINSYQQLIFKDIYHNIDIKYEFHKEGGLKYSLIIHPKSDVSKVKLNYSKNIELDPNGNIKIKTLFGDILEHKPITFYSEQTNAIIASNFTKKDNSISFNIGNYDKTKEIIIDPWFQTPTLPSNWDCIWECETDASGNVYTIGGVAPLRLDKYNAAGTLQWSYNTPYDTTAWLGTFITDNVGNSYISNGSIASILKVNNAGGVVWNIPTPPGLTTSAEFWSMFLNCDQTKMTIGGSSGSPIPIVPHIYEINTINGGITSNFQVGTTLSIMNPQEVRAITYTKNGKYAYLTHDSIGTIHNNFSACGSMGATNNKDALNYSFGYKMEDFRYNNSGMNALAHYGDFLFVHKGNAIEKRELSSFQLVSSATIPLGTATVVSGEITVGNSGIDIDECGNIYVGSKNAVIKYNQSLTIVSTSPTFFNVYDVKINTNGEVIAAGATGNQVSTSRTGYVQSIGMTACLPKTISCCDASICGPKTLCVNDAPTQFLPTTTTGGVWSGSGINATTGLFDPSIAGTGTHSITYTLGCGSDAVSVIVGSCANLEICADTAGNLIVSNGIPNYQWFQWNPGGFITTSTQALCEDCGFTWNIFGGCSGASCTLPAQYELISTNDTLFNTPLFPLKVMDAFGVETIFNSLSEIPSCVFNPCDSLELNLITSTNIACFGASSGAISVEANAGTAPYSFLWSPNNATTASLSNLASGTYKVVATDASGCKDSLILTLTQPNSALSLFTISSPDTCNQQVGFIESTISGGTAPYSYNWNTGATTSNLNNLTFGSYVITITDNLNCQLIDTIAVSNFGAPTISINEIIYPSCNNESDGSISLSISNGTVPYSYVWVPNVGSTDFVENLPPSTYNFLVIDNNGCYITQNFVLNPINNNCGGELIFYSGFTPNNDGINDNWIIEGLPEGLIEVTIFNRWGDVLWQTNQYDNNINVWKGENNKGKPVATGVYFYSVKIENELFNGYIELTR